MFHLKNQSAGFFAGVASLAVIGLLVAMTPNPFEIQNVAIIRGEMDIRGNNHAHESVRIDQGQSYTVPADRFFRIRVVVNQDAVNRTLTLKFDGVEQNQFVQVAFEYTEFDIGYIAPAGTVVSVENTLDKPGYVLGFLEDPMP